MIEAFWVLFVTSVSLCGFLIAWFVVSLVMRRRVSRVHIQQSLQKRHRLTPSQRIAAWAPAVVRRAHESESLVRDPDLKRVIAYRYYGLASSSRLRLVS